MTDLREAILVRLLAVAKEAAQSVDAAFEARRNPVELPGTSKWVVVLDGDEIVDEGDPDGRTPLTTPRRIVMTPEVQFRLIAKSEDAGTILNSLRAALIPAVLGDAQLLTLTPGRSKIRYRGSATVVEAARKVDGAIGVGFSFHYVLKPGDLIPVTA
jgi:hypothetical protein